MRLIRTCSATAQPHPPLSRIPSTSTSCAAFSAILRVRAVSDITSMLNRLRPLDATSGESWRCVAIPGVVPNLSGAPWHAGGDLREVQLGEPAPSLDH